MSGSLRAMAAFATLLLSACASSSEKPGMGAAAAEVELPPPATLAGDWDVFLLDGDERGESLRFLADGTRITWLPGCARQYRTYRLDGEQVAITREPHKGLQAVCKIGLPPALRDYFSAMEKAETVQSVGAGAIRIYGGGEVVLFVPHAGSDE